MYNIHHMITKMHDKQISKLTKIKNTTTIKGLSNLASQSLYFRFPSQTRSSRDPSTGRSRDTPTRFVP